MGILGMALSPKLRDTVIPLTDSVVNNLKGYSGHIEEMREKFQDMVAEAKFENIKNTIDQEVGEDTNE